MEIGIGMEYFLCVKKFLVVINIVTWNESALFVTYLTYLS